MIQHLYKWKFCILWFQKENLKVISGHNRIFFQIKQDISIVDAASCSAIVHMIPFYVLYKLKPIKFLPFYCKYMPNWYNNTISIGWRQLIVGGAMHDMSASIEHIPVKNSNTIHKNVNVDIMWNQLHKILQCTKKRKRKIVHEMWCDDYGNILMCNRAFCKISFS